MIDQFHLPQYTDLTSMDFYLWGYVKEKVYHIPIKYPAIEKSNFEFE